jgi:LmbE family N-acetylglucosaminyl deacetylase
VVAPHPDDETLGCGGAIALLRARGCPVYVLIVSDGTQSHPHSCHYPQAKLRQLREAESLEALTLLQVDPSHVTFLRLPDGAVPPVGTPNQPSLLLTSLDKTAANAAARHAIDSCQDYLTQVQPRVIFLPYQFDPHPDHRATWQLIQSAIPHLADRPRIIEYPIWDWDPTQRQSPDTHYQAWRLDIAAIVKLKEAAIACYRSQITDLINDDPTGFRLAPGLIANFLKPWEIYLEPILNNSSQ